ncbi:DUF4926 domain-containing protein [Zophobihabitans entericus]|uniref:DUF4926 domain-containing protein n=1 Tax=Zophobihabitans entericus TaxID=1635327 RepID=A0A6G9ICS7_9GAMM|nr:DUF4926 domain-containing protein [Zophobihabitans entericus]QIQ22035.1 DUF4926 domain-containing protein [Zophobihabitans entericus]
MIQENDVVIAKKDLSKIVLKGSKGAVVMVYKEPRLGYEVEFVNNHGETLDVITVYPEDIEELPITSPRGREKG